MNLWIFGFPPLLVDGGGARWMAICQAVGCPGIPGSGAGSQIGTLAIKRSSYLWARTSLILKYELLLKVVGMEAALCARGVWMSP